MQKKPDQIFADWEFRRAEALAQKSKQSRRKIGNVLYHWSPMGFAAVLSFICLAGGTVVHGSFSWAIPFLCFLPMCFFFVAGVTFKMQREIYELREQLAKLQETVDEGLKKEPNQSPQPPRPTGG